ncbi:MAG TPA: FAD-dependent oxidoreductase [Polyangiaceae bacterium]|jgi:2-polyprenyl-6-methoxyphenol hydroxylase-like FAD-dependent oxidoreductase|nr:FAD-dependent oxidoreductase [Polyangiaceae bacterium]
MDAEVLVVGAGPTGLVLALCLARLGVRVRIVDKTAEPGTTSRAVAVQARTLEFYRQLGFASEVIDAGLEFAAINVWAGGQKRAHANFGQLGHDLSPFPFALIYPQDEHERLLVQKLEALGVAVERKTELEGLVERGDHVVANVGGTSARFAYVAGCDGAHSSVRTALGVSFAGGTYEHLFYVADVEARGPLMDRELHVSVERNDFIALFPLKGQGRARLIGTVQKSDDDDDRTLGWDDVKTDLLARLHVDVERVNWFSTYHVHHRVAERFRVGRAFLLGDAAHVHSPVGGQGMNTGIGDAVNLAWKLADVLRGRAPAVLLDTYEPERIAFARRLVATTDRAFKFVTQSGGLMARLRVNVAPPVVSAAFSTRAVRRLLFRTVSQMTIEYRESPLSEGRAGRVHAGDRLAWVGPAGTEHDNFAPLASLAWQVHVYGRAEPEFAAFCARQSLPLRVFSWSPEGAHAGFAENATYLVRPDGYVAFAEPSQSTEKLAQYLSAHLSTERRT